MRDSYKLIRCLGRGSSGEAVLAEDGAGRQCVLKFTEVDSLPETQSQQSMREAHILRRLSHPNILRIQRAFLHQRYLVLSSEFCDAGDLEALISRRRELRDGSSGHKDPERRRCGLSEAAVKGIVVQMAHALEYVHSVGVIHRDLKSSNIFLTERGVVKVGDFGVASEIPGGLTPGLVGSIHYLAPELCDGGSASAASDCWAVGVILYEMCALELPFQGSNPLVVTIRITRGLAEPLPSSFSAELRAACSALLCPNRYRRLTAAQVAALGLAGTATRRTVSKREAVEVAEALWHADAPERPPVNFFGPSELERFLTTDGPDCKMLA